jgi:hypothetical protein
MVIELINDKDKWDEFVDQSANGLLFHKWDFIHIIGKYTGYKVLPYGIYKGTELFCLLPIFYKNHRGLKLAYSPPQTTATYVPYMGHVMKTSFDSFKQRKKETYLETMVEELDRELKKLSINYISISTVPKFIDSRPFKWNDYRVLVRYTYIVDLRRPIDDIWNSFALDCRNHIKDTMKKYPLEIVQKTDVDLFSKIMRETLSKERMTYFQRQDQNYLKELVEAYPNNLKMYYVYLKDEIVSAFLNIEYKDRVIGWMGAPAMKRDVSANDYTLWEFMKKAKQEGFKEFENWGGDVKRLNQFKSKFNPSLELCLSYNKKDTLGSAADWCWGVLASQPYMDFIRQKLM